MKQKTLLLTILFTIGLTTQYCDWGMCNCEPVEFPYFDIFGIELSHNYLSSETDNLDEGISFDNYKGLNLSYLYDVIATKQNHKNCTKPFSLMGEAYGCDCDYDGNQGSKDEKLTSLVITTVNDFNSLYLANDTIRVVRH